MSDRVGGMKRENSRYGSDSSHIFARVSYKLGIDPGIFTRVVLLHSNELSSGLLSKKNQTVFRVANIIDNTDYACLTRTNHVVHANDFGDDDLSLNI
jgi:hypothetical protein